MAPLSKILTSPSLKHGTWSNGCSLQIVGRALLAEQANPIVEPGLFQRPAGAQVADQALGELGHPAEGGDLDRRVGIDWHGFALLQIAVAMAS